MFSPFNQTLKQYNSVYNPVGQLPKIVTVIFCVFYVSCSNTQPQEDVIARVGNAVLTKSDLEAMLPLVPFPLSQNNLRVTVNTWVENELLYQEAIKMGLNKNALLKGKIKRYKKSVFSATFIDMYLSDRISITTEEIRNYYRQNRNSFIRQQDNVKVLHFFLKTQEEANEVKNKLLLYEGTTRQELLSNYNAETKIVSKGTLIPEIESLLFKSKSYSGVVGPVKSKTGYHVLQILGWYPAQTIRGVDEVIEEISQHLSRQKVDILTAALIDSLITEYEVEINLGVLHE